MASRRHRTSSIPLLQDRRAYAEISILLPSILIAHHIEASLRTTRRDVEQIRPCRGPLFGPRTAWVTSQNKDDHLGLFTLNRVNGSDFDAETAGYLSESPHHHPER